MTRPRWVEPEEKKMQKVLIASLAGVAMLVGSMAVSTTPAAAQSLQKFCWNHPYAPICWDLFHHHHHNDDYWWYY